ncbi:MAG: metal-dependent transcriptional regulator [Sedimentibacter sp.]|uniref:metal-dependent transcriptional regulator n=1 Tax=Sedimentibacter sp. TaxID=1960295 RepID=UPI0029827AC2|nr:metal-dependent transcriptional regulator [Sedimentibacter sp.]MDW5299675.1 metal-dependent transcriptional regulator [Sedimentibacter sp.]
MYESGENYLETILILEEKIGSVRSIDVARELNLSKPSVSRAVGLLKDDGYITVSEEGFLKLTEKGREKAVSIYEKHKILTEFLIKVTGAPDDIAEKDACRIEHIISRETYQGIKKYLNKEDTLT